MHVPVCCLISPHFQSMSSDLTFTFPRTAINAPILSPPHTAREGAELTTPGRTRDMASRAAALLLLGLVCVEFAAGKQKGGFKFLDGSAGVCAHLLPAASNTFCLCLPAAQVVLDCCKTKTSKFLPLQRIESYSVQDAGTGCDINATV